MSIQTTNQKDKAKTQKEEEQLKIIFPQIRELEDKIKLLKSDYDFDSKYIEEGLKINGLEENVLPELTEKANSATEVGDKQFVLMQKREKEHEDNLVKELVQLKKSEEEREDDFMQKLTLCFEEKYKLENQLEDNTLYKAGKDLVKGIEAFSTQMTVATNALLKDEIGTLYEDRKQHFDLSQTKKVVSEMNKMVKSCISDLIENSNSPELMPYIGQIVPHLRNISYAIIEQETILNTRETLEILDYQSYLGNAAELAEESYKAMARRFEHIPHLKENAELKVQAFQKLSNDITQDSQAIITANTKEEGLKQRLLMEDYTKQYNQEIIESNPEMKRLDVEVKI